MAGDGGGAEGDTADWGSGAIGEAVDGGLPDDSTTLNPVASQPVEERAGGERLRLESVCREEQRGKQHQWPTQRHPDFCGSW
jgi:hypothetical protein